MAQTIDYKVNIDVGQAMADLQMVDMQMDSSFGGPPGTSFQGTRQMFGDMGYAAGQMGGRMASPFAQAGGFYGGHGPQMNFGTAAYTALHPNMAGSPMGVSRQAWHAQAQAHMAASIGRGATGAALGFMGDAGGLLAGAGAAGLGSALGLGALGAGVLGVGAFMGVSSLAGKVAEGVGTRNMMQDVVMATSGMGLGGSRVAERAITNMQHSNPLLNTEDMMNIAVTGSQMGMLGGENPQEYLKKFRKLTSDVQEVATVLNTSLAEGMQVMGQLQGAGVGAGAISTLAGMGGGDPSRIRALIGTGMMGSAAFSGTGMARGGGFWQAIQTSGVVGGMGLSGEYMHQAGGRSAVTGMLLGSNIEFLQSGAGMMMQAGVWQGGASMGGGGGMGAMDMMQAGAGNLGNPGEYFSFMRNRANAAGRMSPSERLHMEGKFNVDLATMAADQLGSDVGDMLFYQGMQRYGNAPQAEAWARAQQRYAKGGGGGGPSRDQLISAQIERQYSMGEQTYGAGAVMGGLRDRVDSWFNEKFVDPVISIQDSLVAGISGDLAAGRGVLGIGGMRSPLMAPRDLTRMSIAGNLESVLAGESGLSIADNAWAGNIGRTLDTMGVTRSSTAGAGMLEVTAGSFASIPEIYQAQRAADAAVQTGWNTNYQRISSARGPDYQAQLATIRMNLMGNTGDISNIFRTQGFGGVAGHVGADISTPAGAAALRTVSEARDWGISPEAVPGLNVHQALATAAGGKRNEYLDSVYSGLHGNAAQADAAARSQQYGDNFSSAGAWGGGLAAAGLATWGVANFWNPTGWAALAGAAAVIGTAGAVGAHVGGSRARQSVQSGVAGDVIGAISAGDTLRNAAAREAWVKRATPGLVGTNTAFLYGAEGMARGTETSLAAGRMELEGLLSLTSARGAVAPYSTVMGDPVTTRRATGYQGARGGGSTVYVTETTYPDYEMSGQRFGMPAAAGGSPMGWRGGTLDGGGFVGDMLLPKFTGTPSVAPSHNTGQGSYMPSSGSGLQGSTNQAASAAYVVDEYRAYLTNRTEAAGGVPDA